MDKRKVNIIVCFFIFFSSLFVFTRGLDMHGLEYRDDEIFYYHSTQEMLENNNYLSPTYFGENRFQKPILFYWLILVSYAMFGINWFAARFISTVFASLSLVVGWLLGRDLFGKKVAALSTVILMTVPLFFRHAKNAVPDMALNFFVIFAHYCSYKFISASTNSKSLCDFENSELRRFGDFQKYSTLFFVSCALGFMVKGLAAIVFPVVTMIFYLAWTKNLNVLLKIKYARNFLIMASIILPWFIVILKMHGREYFDYMVINETSNRILGDTGRMEIFAWVQTLGQHLLYYFKIIFSYFAPWSLFFIVAVPLALWKILKKVVVSERKVKIGKEGCGYHLSLREKEGALLFLVIWIFFVIFIFSGMYFVINHYMLILTVPFSLLVGVFLLENLNAEFFFSRILIFFRKYSMIFIFSSLYGAFVFLAIFFAGINKLFLPFCVVLYFFAARYMSRSKKNMVRPLILGFFIIFVMSQMTIWDKANLTAHATLRRFAKTINFDEKAEYIVGVGSHDIHEKEFQVYFDKKVDKASVSWEWGMEESLSKYFSQKGKIYCLIKKEDYDKYLKNNVKIGEINIMQEDYIFRKRMHIDANFFKALLSLDQEKVHHYFMEKLLLVKKK